MGKSIKSHAERQTDRLKRTKKTTTRKKRKKKTDLVPIDGGKLAHYKTHKDDPKARKKLERRLKKVKSVFKNRVPEIQELLENDNNDSAVNNARKGMLIMLTELIPIAEANYRKYGNERAAYALNTLITQMRELIADIQAEQNRSELLSRILAEVLHPRFLLLGQHMIDSFYYIRTTVEPNLKDAAVQLTIDEINSTAKSSGKFVESMYDDIQKGLTKVLSE